MKISKTFRFEAAHMLVHHSGKCRNMHGHSYKLEVMLDGPVGKDGMVLDFGELKVIVQPIIDAMDHAFLFSSDTPYGLVSTLRDLGSDVYEVPGEPTAEVIVEHLAHRIRGGIELLTKVPLSSISVRLWETDTCWAATTVQIGKASEEV